MLTWGPGVMDYLGEAESDQGSLGNHFGPGFALGAGVVSIGWRNR